MRVAMVAYANYESNSRIQQYAKALVARGDTVDIFCSEGHVYTRSEGTLNVHSVHARKPGEGRFAYAWDVLLFLLKCTWILTKMHWKNRYDVIHVHSVPDFLVFVTVIPKLLGASVILDIHDILPEFYAAQFEKGRDSIFFKFLIVVEKASIAFADYVIVANPIWEERLLSRSVKPGKVTSIGNHPNPDIFFWRPKERCDGKFIVTYPGSLNWHQGLEIAIRAFVRVAQEAPEAEFHIYGGGPNRRTLERLAQELGLAQRVKFMKGVPTQEVVRIMAESDLGVVPKRSKSVFGTEAASTKIMEFMALGVPLVVSRTKIDSLYHTNATVKFYDADDPDELAQAILLLRNSPARRQELTANALAYVREHGWDRKKEKYLAIVDKLTNCKPMNSSSESGKKEIERTT